MAFCTGCGAQVNGAFCTQCGAPAGRSGAAQAAPPPVPGPTPAAAGLVMPAPPPVARRTSPLVWVLVIVVGLFVVGFIGVVGAGVYVAHKARQAGLDPALMSRNPGLAIGKLIAAANPDAEVLKTDEGAGTITVRDKKTGKVVTVTFDQARNGGIKFTAEGEKGETASMEFGVAANKPPDWVPIYPGATAQGTFSVRGSSADGSGTGGNYTYSTSDSAEKVFQFYENKAKDSGMTPKVTTHVGQGGMMVFADDASKRSLTIVVGEESGKTNVNITYGEKQ